jgi:hypothetical protein
MTPEDLETAVARSGVVHYRWLTSDDNPDAFVREGYRGIVREIAAAEVWPPEPPAYPPLATQAANLLGAAARFVGSGCATVDQAEFDRRRAVCSACPNLDAESDRCRVCACFLAVKPWMKTERCPEGRWEAPHDAR